MKIPAAAKSLSNLSLRTSTLVFRFVLSFYIVKYLGLEASGVFGLALGVTSIMPALVGWGLNYFVARDVVGQPAARAGLLVKSRLAVTTLSLAGVSLAGLILAVAAGQVITHLHLLILALVWLETYALDVHMPLIAQEMAVEANVLVFLRSALWVPVVIGLGLAFPPLRSIEWVFAGWILAYIPTVVALFYFLRRWPLDTIVRAPLDRGWIGKRLKGSWFIYISDLSIVGLMYADRYIVNFVLGLTLTGVYTFFWSLTNALQTLITTAVVQLALPVLFKAHTEGNMAGWREAMRRKFLRTAGLSLIVAVLVFLGSELILRFMDMRELGEHRLLFVLMLLAAVVRSCSELLNIGLTSLNKDRHYAAINFIGVILAMGSAFLFMRWMGLDGAGVAALITALILLAVRLACLIRFTSEP